MTEGAQQALRRTMELFSHSTRFALACNTSSKIIEPLQSRCAILRYTRLSDVQITRRLLQIIEKENVNYNNDGLEAIIFTTEGDMRVALNNLQSTHVGFGFVSPENVFKVCDQPHPVAMKAILSSCAGGDVDGAHQHLLGLWQQGYSAPDIIQVFFRVVKVLFPPSLPSSPSSLHSRTHPPSSTPSSRRR